MGARNPGGVVLAQHLPGLVIYRFDAPVFFANAKTFRDAVRRRLAAAEPPPRWIPIAAPYHRSLPLLPTVGAAVAVFRAETGAEWLAAGVGASAQHCQATPLTGGNWDG